MKFFFISLFCAALSFGFSGPQKPHSAVSLPVAFNIAAKQRMLSQRICKDYLYTLAGVETAKCSKEMAASVLLFDENFKLLVENSTSPALKAQLAQVDGLWKPYKEMATDQPSRDKALLMLNGATEVLEACHNVVMEMERDIKANPTKYSVNVETFPYIAIAGRQRMFSQRIAAYFCALSLNLGDKTVAGTLENTLIVFKSDFSKLLTNNANTSEIDDAISVMINIRNEMIVMAEDGKKGNYDLSGMFQSSNNVLESMDKITALYTKLSEGQ